MNTKKGRNTLSNEELEYRNKVAELIKEKVLSSSFNQSQVAKLSGVPQNTLSRYVNAKSTPKPEYLQKLADFFQIPIEELDPRQSTTATDERFERLTKNYNALNDENKNRLVDYSDELLEEPRMALAASSGREVSKETADLLKQEFEEQYGKDYL